jgi:hypothetical protein
MVTTLSPGPLRTWLTDPISWTMPLNILANTVDGGGARVESLPLKSCARGIPGCAVPPGRATARPLRG